jgi:hypothetical protein
VRPEGLGKFKISPRRVLNPWPSGCAVSGPVSSRHSNMVLKLAAEWCGILFFFDRLCGLLAWVPGYRVRSPGFDSWRNQIFWEVVGLKQGPLSPVTTIEGLLGRNNSGFSLENREYSCRDPPWWPRDTLYLKKVGSDFPTSIGRSVGIVCSQTKAAEFPFIVFVSKMADQAVVRHCVRF